MAGDTSQDGAIRQWYVLRSKPKKEAASAALLQRAGIEVYVPEVRVQKRPYHPPTVEPLFPGYLFSRLSPQLGEIRLARYTPGILYVVGFGEEACPVPDDLIVSIQQRIAREKGRAAFPDYQPGERVLITSGPLRDLEGVFDRRLSASGRVRVFIHILHRLCGAEVHIGQLQRAGKAAGIA